MHRRGHQPWCQPHQLVRMQLQHPARLPGRPHRAGEAEVGPPARYRPRQQLRYPAQDQELHCRYILVGSVFGPQGV